MLQGEHSATLSTFIKLTFFIKTFVFSIFKWPLKTGFTVFRVNRVSIQGGQFYLAVSSKLAHYVNVAYTSINISLLSVFV